MQTVLEWDSGVVADGAVIDSPIINGSSMGYLEVFVDNSDALAADRNLTVAWLASDGVTPLYVATVACAKGGRYAVMVSEKISPVASPPAGVTLLPLGPALKMRVSLAVGGTKAARLAVYGGR